MTLSFDGLQVLDHQFVNIEIFDLSNLALPLWRLVIGRPWSQLKCEDTTRSVVDSHSLRVLV